jgi:hypothetical protein
VIRPGRRQIVGLLQPLPRLLVKLTLAPRRTPPNTQRVLILSLPVHELAKTFRIRALILASPTRTGGLIRILRLEFRGRLLRGKDSQGLRFVRQDERRLYGFARRIAGRVDHVGHGLNISRGHYVPAKSQGPLTTNGRHCRLTSVSTRSRTAKAGKSRLVR